MSKLDELINELCPDGVEYVQFNTVLDYEQPTKYIVEATNYDDTFETPVLTAGQTFILGYSNEKNGIYVASEEKPVIIFDDFTTSFHWVNFSFKIKSSAMKMLRVKPDKAKHTILRYVYHCMKNIQYEPVDHSRQWIAKYSTFLFPLPPLPVQEEIVRILDNFTELTAELTAELSAELTARKKQYEYYRDSLLTFGDEVEFAPLSSVSDVIDSLHQTPTYSESGFSMIRVTDIKGGFIDTDNTLKVDRQIYDIFTKNYAPKKGDIVMSRVGSYGNVGVVPQNNCSCMGQNTVVISPKINAVFLYQYLSSLHVQNYIENNVSGGSQKTLSLKAIKAIPIPLLDDKVQVYIGDIIKKFDTLCNDISNGLPDEIKARQQQYEYYRDKLLTFPKAKLEV